jgi:hypothetical protein
MGVIAVFPRENRETVGFHKRLVIVAHPRSIPVCPGKDYHPLEDTHEILARFGIGPARRTNISAGVETMVPVNRQIVGKARANPALVHPVRKQVFRCGWSVACAQHRRAEGGFIPVALPMKSATRFLTTAGLFEIRVNCSGR